MWIDEIVRQIPEDRWDEVWDRMKLQEMWPRNFPLKVISIYRSLPNRAIPRHDPEERPISANPALREKIRAFIASMRGGSPQPKDEPEPIAEILGGLTRGKEDRQ